MATITFDTETTGLDPVVDRIIELCALVDGEPPRTWRFRPLVPVSAEATAVHGISNEDLADCPCFADCAAEIHDLFQSATVIIGYNVQFDIDMLCAEFERCGGAWSLDGISIIDPLKIWYAKEKRTLEGAYERFTGLVMQGAHAAENDVLATVDVLHAMREEFCIEDLTMPELALLCDPERATWVGQTNHFVWNDGVVCFGFGKHKGKPALDEQGYLEWMHKGTFPRSVKDTISRLIAGELTRG